MEYWSIVKDSEHPPLQHARTPHFLFVVFFHYQVAEDTPVAGC